MTMPVLTTPNDLLRQKSRGVSVEELRSDETQKLIDEMIKSMKVENGVGLAAPQVGVHQRIIIAETKQGPKAFINPEITKSSHRKIKSEEGCLSIPGVVGIVQRNKTVSVKALDRDGKDVELEDVDGLLSIIFQHEIDHLDGILFIDRAKKVYHAKGDVLV